jgi:hypothetical protein
MKREADEAEITMLIFMTFGALRGEAHCFFQSTGS